MKEKLICLKTERERATAEPRIPVGTVRRGEKTDERPILVETPETPVFKNTRSKIGRTKIGRADLDSPCRGLFTGFYELKNAPTVARQINFSSASMGGPIQL